MTIKLIFENFQQLQIDVSEEAMLGMLAQLPQLCRENAQFLDCLSNLAFVKTGDGILARVWELYDPSVSELHDLLEGGEFYPAASFLKPELIATLIRLGLQTSLDRAGILKVARSISASLDDSSANQARLLKRGRSLLTFLVKSASLLGLDKRFECSNVSLRLHLLHDLAIALTCENVQFRCRRSVAAGI